MKKNILALLILLSILYFTFIIADFTRMPAANYLKYAAMVLVFLLALSARNGFLSAFDFSCVAAALFFTLASDYFLLFTSRYPAGVTVFCGAHLLYIRRYRRACFLPFLLASLVLLPLSYLPLPIRFPHYRIVTASVIYAVLILTATVLAFRSALPKMNRHLASAGMILFLLCDVNVVAFNVSPGGSVHRISGILIWIFYLPAQILIALSAHKSLLAEKAAPDHRPAVAEKQDF